MGEEEAVLVATSIAERVKARAAKGTKASTKPARPPPPRPFPAPAPTASFCAPLDLAAELKLPRYKLVSYVVVGENLGQGIRVASRCLWDATTDNYASINFKSDALFAAAMLFAAYCE